MSASVKATSGGMSLQDVELCRSAVKALTGSKLANYNALFLNPFDLSQTPGYLDVCPKAMDLSTLSYNLESGSYATRNEFFQECFMIFENAIKYHSDKDTTKWIVSPAKQMLKAAKKEQQKAEKKAEQLAAKLLATGGETTTTTVTATKKIIKESSSAPAPKLKLKLGGSSTATGTSGRGTTSTDAKPKIKIKQQQTVVSQGKTPPPGVNIKAEPGGGGGEPPSKKPRLTLKIGKNKTEDSSTTSAAGAANGITPKSTASSTSGSTGGSSSKISIKLASGGGGGGGGASRGKELPKGIAPPEPKKSESKKASSSDSSSTIKKSPGKKTAATTKKAAGKQAGASKSTPKPTTSSAVTSKMTPPSIKKEKPPSKTKITIKKASDASSKASTFTTPKDKDKSATSAPGPNVPMTPTRKAQCSKILNGLKRRQAKNIVWFEKPVSDKKIIQDYKAKIRHPMDLATMQAKLDNGGYAAVGAFVLDLRRIFGNCLQYNTSIVKDSLRPIAVETFETAEQLMTYFLAKPEYPQAAYAPLLFCWKLCLSVLDTLYNLTNPDDKNPTAYFFMHPVAFYFGGTLPPDYLQKAPKPMDFGTITGKLVQGQYSTVDQFESDCKLVIDNCMAFNGSKPENKAFCDQATRLNQVLQQQLDALNRYIKSPGGQAAQKTVQLGISTSTLPKPPIPLLLEILTELRDQKYTDKMTKITEPAMTTFEKPVSVAVYPDYMQYVQSPMDLQTVERKTKNGQYSTPEDFEYAMVLMFQNCITYNVARKMDHLVALGKFGMKSFRRIFSSKMKVFDDPALAPTPKETPSSVLDASIRKDPPEGAAEQGPSKKLKIDVSGVSRGKTAPRISLSSATLSEAQKAAQNQGRKSPKLHTTASSASAVPKTKPNQPVPLHIAIAQVKEKFPLRRNVKSLQSWEAACARFFKELMKHPWISAARPKFIFHVPVSVVFPALKDAYLATIKKPMDLTTVECTLLAGNRYAVPEDFVNDVALVFANSIQFNQAGRDVGDPLSCAYYDASIHLLKYTRWLSLELLMDYVQESDHIDEPEGESIPVSSWKLTTGNRKVSRSEMEAIVLKEPIEKSLEGDRFTWMETECDKLLKSLRHQADFRYMTYFLTPNYPPDYSAFISRPMDWEKVQKTLKKRQYDTFGAIIDDLRLVFANALKYNARHAGTDTVSGHAYDAAKIMSAKLETAINKLMLTVSDRVERERIDHNNAEREIEAAERAEEEKIREQWKSESGKVDAEGDESAPLKVEGAQRIRSAKRIILRRKSDTDFEVPFFDEEDYGQHEQSYFEVMKQQKSTFECQRADLVKMRRATACIGQAVFSRSIQAELALEWIAEEQEKLGLAVLPPSKERGLDGAGPGEQANQSIKSSRNIPAASSVLAKLDVKNRNPLKISFLSRRPTKTANKKKNAVKTTGMEDWGDDEEC